MKVQSVDEDGNVVPSATGALVRNPRTILVTNWHVVSGRDTFTGDRLNPKANLPFRVRVSLVGCMVYREIIEELPNGRREMERRTPFSQPFSIDTPLCESVDGVANPRWREHPDLGRVCDVAALDIGTEYRNLIRQLNPEISHPVPGTVYEPYSL